MSRLFTALLCLGVTLCVFSSPASAQVGRDHFAAWDRYEGGHVTPQQGRQARVIKGQQRAVRVVRATPQSRRATQQARLSPPISRSPVAAVSRAIEQTTRTVSGAVSGATGIPGEIASFLQNVASQCGAVRVISTFRRGAVVAGTNRSSCHAAGQAVDYQISNPSCALRVAQGVRLGHSIDYAHVNHFHVSNCAREMGARFAHGGGRSYARRAGRSRAAARQIPHRARYAQYRRR